MRASAAFRAALTLMPHPVQTSGDQLVALLDRALPGACAPHALPAALLEIGADKVGRGVDQQCVEQSLAKVRLWPWFNNYGVPTGAGRAAAIRQHVLQMPAADATYPTPAEHHVTSHARVQNCMRDGHDLGPLINWARPTIVPRSNAHHPDRIGETGC
jgi:hypothetical protein